MPPTILIYNPSARARGGHVTIEWREFRQCCSTPDYPENQFVLYDHANREVPYQIDVVDPNDPSKKRLVMAISAQVPPGPPDCSRHSMAVRIARGQPRRVNRVAATLRSRGIELKNGMLTAYISFSRIHDARNKPWFAGSATTIQLGTNEILDPGGWLRGWLGHDPEKRCMQIDCLYLPSNSKASEFDLRVDLFNRDYEYVAHNEGPVRATVTIRSAPFNHLYRDSVAGDEHIIACRLYRVISLYNQTNYIVEELYIRDVSDYSGGGDRAHVPRFVARYYAHMNWGHMPEIFQFSDITGWFAASADWSGPKVGYGFGTTSRTSPIAYPHRDTSVLYDAPVHENEFSWLLFPCEYARNIHVFMRRDARDFDDETGRRWHDVIYRSLQARMVS